MWYFFLNRGYLKVEVMQKFAALFKCRYHLICSSAACAINTFFARTCRKSVLLYVFNLAEKLHFRVMTLAGYEHCWMSKSENVGTSWNEGIQLHALKCSLLICLIHITNAAQFCVWTYTGCCDQNKAPWRAFVKTEMIFRVLYKACNCYATICFSKKDSAPWSHRFGLFKNNVTKMQFRFSAL
jgi:hypothetical protein